MAGSINMDMAAVPGNAQAVTPSDTTVLNCAGLYIGTTGDVVVETQQGNVVTFNNYPAGSWLWLQVAKVRAATTAGNIVAVA